PSVLRTSMAQPTIWNTSSLNSNLSSSRDSSRFVSIRVHSWLLLVRRNFGQLWGEQPFLFFLVQRQTGRRNDLRGDEDDQVLFGVLLRIRAKCSADKWNVPYDGNFILSFLHVFAHQPAKHHRLPVINANTGRDFACAKHGLVYDVRRELNRLGNRNTNSGIHTHRKNWATVIDEALKLHDLRNQIEIDRRVISAYYWFHFESNPARKS